MTPFKITKLRFKKKKHKKEVITQSDSITTHSLKDKEINNSSSTVKSTVEAPSSSEPGEYDTLFKCIVVGDANVGKTALTVRFSKGIFTEDYKVTIGVDFHVKTLNIKTKDGMNRCRLQIWDTGGQERFSSIRPMYYRGSMGALLVYDLANFTSFEHLEKWIQEVKNNVKNEIPLILVGNKSDLVEDTSVHIKEVNDFTKKFNLYYMQTSAKTGDYVGDCFYVLASMISGLGVPDQLLADKEIFAPGTFKFI